MRRKIRPKRGYQPKFLLGTEGERDFPTAVVDRLAQRHKIADEHKPKLAAFLRFAIGIYRRTEHNVDEAPQPKHVRAALTEIHQTATALADQLKTLDPTSDRLLWMHEREMEDLAHLENGPLRSKYGHSFFRSRTQLGGIDAWYLDERKIHEALAILIGYSSDALRWLSRGHIESGGRPSDQALKIWVTNAASFWADVLKRRFTYNPHKLGGSLAFRFCCDALEASRLPFTEKALGTHMSILVQQRRKAKQR